MRNLAEYPITNGEILGSMDRVVIASKTKNRGMIPDMETYLLSIAREIVRRSLREEQRPTTRTRRVSDQQQGS